VPLARPEKVAADPGLTLVGRSVSEILGLV
jgi:hypothetical protein